MNEKTIELLSLLAASQSDPPSDYRAKTLIELVQAAARLLIAHPECVGGTVSLRAGGLEVTLRPRP